MPQVRGVRRWIVAYIDREFNFKMDGAPLRNAVKHDNTKRDSKNRCLIAKFSASLCSHIEYLQNYVRYCINQLFIYYSCSVWTLEWYSLFKVHTSIHFTPNTRLRTFTIQSIQRFMQYSFYHLLFRKSESITHCEGFLFMEYIYRSTKFDAGISLPGRPVKIFSLHIKIISNYLWFIVH